MFVLIPSSLEELCEAYTDGYIWRILVIEADREAGIQLFRHEIHIPNSVE